MISTAHEYVVAPVGLWQSFMAIHLGTGAGTASAIDGLARRDSQRSIAQGLEQKDFR